MMDVFVTTKNSVGQFNQFGELVIACRAKCGRQTTMLGTGLCDFCWGAARKKTPCEPGYCSDQSREFAISWNRKRKWFHVVIGSLSLAIVATIVAGVMGL